MKIRPRRLLESPYAHLTLVALIWAGNILLARAVHEQITPVSLNFWRWGVSSLVFVPLLAPQLWAARRIILRDWKVFVVLGTMGVALFHSLLYVALSMTLAMNVSIISSMTPIVIVLIAWAWIGERLSPRQGLGVLISLIGVLAIISRGDPSVLLHLRMNPGDLVALVTVPMWGTYTVLLRRYKSELPGATMLAAIILVGTLLLLPVFIYDELAGARSSYNAATLGTILYVSLLGSVLAYWLWNRAVAIVGANRAGLFLHLIPVFTAVMAVAFLGEQPHLYHALGIALIFGGIYFVTGRWATA